MRKAANALRRTLSRIQIATKTGIELARVYKEQNEARKTINSKIMKVCVLFAALISTAIGQTLTCRTQTMPSLNGQCPTGMTIVSDGDCCNDGDVQTQTPTPVCEDKVNPNTGVSDCPANANLCNDSRYRSFMRTECPKTCKCCSSDNGNTNCVDKVNARTGISECPQNANLCRHSGYVDFMRNECPKTCGYC
ncbi:unnamed protein product [Caenorhabditis bovis]|uniref:ShKT domain-containing protein n=1 Tax=Caenorhabditis bovis TaxID=2654633 RepID=A0A8S1F3L4_9PELO|nr:unnamed protein product [Caenorhabditis bovis]